MFRSMQTMRKCAQNGQAQTARRRTAGRGCAQVARELEKLEGEIERRHAAAAGTTGGGGGGGGGGDGSSSAGFWSKNREKARPKEGAHEENALQKEAVRAPPLALFGVWDRVQLRVGVRHLCPVRRRLRRALLRRLAAAQAAERAQGAAVHAGGGG